MRRAAGKRNGAIGKVELKGTKAGKERVLTGLTGLTGLLGPFQSGVGAVRLQIRAPIHQPTKRTKLWADLFRRKGDRQKARIATRLRQETTMTWDWIAEKLAMGAGAYAANCARAERKERGYHCVGLNPLLIFRPLTKKKPP
jgi:hypothetical protein